MKLNLFWIPVTVAMITAGCATQHSSMARNAGGENSLQNVFELRAGSEVSSSTSTNESDQLTMASALALALEKNPSISAFSTEIRAKDAAALQAGLLPNPEPYFSQVRAVADDDEFRVSGRLRLKGNIGANVPDFVKVALVDETGKVIESRKVAYYPRLLSGRRKHREARFTARFDQAPPIWNDNTTGECELR